MLVTKTFNVDLVRLEVPPTWACMQGDANSRAICYRLYADGLSYEIPSGVSLRIAYEKADKTSGVYSQLPDGSSAYEISGNTVTIRLIEDVSAKSGMALVQPILYDSDGNILGIWSTEIVVWRGVSKESSSTGVNYSSYENDIGTLQAKVKRLESLVDGGSTITADFHQGLEKDRLEFGRTYTFSVISSDGRLGKHTFVLTSDTDINVGFGFGYFVFYLSGNNVWFRIYGDGSTYKAAKLELGSQQTLAHQDADGNWVLNEIPDYGEQLARCQRYFQTFATESLRPTNALDFRPVMRATPALSTITVGGKTLYTASADL